MLEKVSAGEGRTEEASRGKHASPFRVETLDHESEKVISCRSIQSTQVDPMKTWQRVLIVLTGSLLACGPSRINKLPIPRERVLKAYRLMAEADRMLKEGKDHLAILKYIEATRLNPYHEMIFNKLAVAYCRIGRYPQAKTAATRSIRLQPNYAAAHNTLGIVAMSARQSKKAIRHFKKGIALDPDRSHLYLNLGYGQLMQGRYDLARQAYQEALALDPEVFERKTGTRLTFPDPITFDVDLNYDMARLFAEFGDRDSCLQYLDKALEAGFPDQKRLAEEPAFDQLRQSKDFIDLLGRYGLSLK